MADTTQTVPTAQFDNQIGSQGGADDAVDVFIREFSQEAGKRVGTALAEEIHNDPEVRRLPRQEQASVSASSQA